MKKNLLFLFLLIIFSIPITAQDKSSIISGRVYNLEPSNPLGGVNIFISGTMIGTSSDKYGFFEIKNVPQGMHELVVSMIGFESVIEKIKIGNNKKRELTFRLKEKPYELDSVQVVSNKPEEWLENLDFFKRKFLGDNEYFADCVIENEIYLDFSLDNSNNFTASIHKPLIITNKALGYKIECELASFSYNKEIGEYNYWMETRFSELKLSEEELESVKHNRYETYLGSLTYFFKCLVNDDWMDKAYEIILFKDLNSDFGSRNVVYTAEILNPVPDTGLFRLKFDDYLRVKIDYRNRVSVLKLINEEILIDSNGNVLNPESFVLFGDWANHGISKLLPRYVDYGKRN